MKFTQFNKSSAGSAVAKSLYSAYLPRSYKALSGERQWPLNYVANTITSHLPTQHSLVFIPVANK